MPRDLDTFDFRESAVNQTQLRQLYTGEYLATARNIVSASGTGTRKRISRRLSPGTSIDLDIEPFAAFLAERVAWSTTRNQNNRSAAVGS